MYTALIHTYSLRDPQSTSRPTARQQEQLAAYKSMHPPPHPTYRRQMSDLYIDPPPHPSSSPSEGVCHPKEHVPHTLNHFVSPVLSLSLSSVWLSAQKRLDFRQFKKKLKKKSEGLNQKDTPPDCCDPSLALARN